MAKSDKGSAAALGSADRVRMAIVAWVLTSIYDFYQYTMRSAPSVMMPELSDAFGITPVAVAAIVGIFYYGYSPFSLVAGVAMDRLGPRRLVPAAAAVVGIGALLFATGQSEIASIGRFLQGAGGVFALVGAIDIATKHFSPTRGDPDRRDADVRYGRRIRGSVHCRPTHRERRFLERLLGGNGHRRVADRRNPVCVTSEG